jgi:hypothetical protein
LDGSLGSWQLANPLPYSAYFLSASVWNNRIYVIGGWTDSGETNGVFSANIQSDGSLSTWSAQTIAPTGIFTHAGVANGMLYVLGGGINQGTALTSNVYFTKINADGSLAGWKLTAPMPQAIGNFSAVAADGRLFSMGGWNASTPINSFYITDVAGGGSLVAWSAGSPLPQKLFYLAATISDSNIYVSGGASPTQPSSTVYSMALPAPPVVPTLVAHNFTNGNFQLQLASTTNTGFGLLASTNLTSWTNLGWGFTGTNGTLLFTDTNGASFPHRFYRAYWPLP